jgi:hypothetical protein
MNPTQSFGSGERDGNGTAFAFTRQRGQLLFSQMPDVRIFGGRKSKRNILFLPNLC